MKISVLMTVYNENLGWVKQSLDSLLNQTYKDIEIIVVIDNPEDKALLDLIIKYSNDNFCIKYLQNQNNLGLALSLNKAFKLATGYYIARMDADDVSILNRFEKQVNFLDENPQYDLITSSCNYINEDSEIIGTRKDKKINSYNQLVKNLEVQNFLIHPSWMMRRSLFEELNGYRNFECSQDYDFILRALTRGFKIYYSNDVLINYRIRDSSISVSKGYRQHIIAKYILKCYFERKTNGNDDFTLENLTYYVNEELSNKNEVLFIESKKYLFELKNAHKKTDKLLTLIKLIFNPFGREQLLNFLKLRKNEKVGGLI